MQQRLQTDLCACSTTQLVTTGQLHLGHTYLLMSTLFIGFLILNIFLMCISFFIPSPATEISKTNYTDLNPLINMMINSNYTKGIQAANVLLSLRLVGILNQCQEQQLIQQVKCNVNSHGECLYSLEDLEDLRIHKGYIQQEIFGKYSVSKVHLLHLSQLQKI